jgi:hypothetical protein
VIFKHINVFMRTTLDLPDETFRQLKAQAALNGLKLKELVTQLIQRGLAAGVTPPDPAPLDQARLAARRVSYPIPIARESDGSVTPYLSNAVLYAILDDEDLTHVHPASNSEPNKAKGR